MDTANLDKYLRMPTENELRRDNTLPAESTWEMWRAFPASGGILVAKQDRYREVPYHRHPWFELVYMYDGSETILVEGQEILLQKGQCLLINRGVTHFCRSLPEEIGGILDHRHVTLDIVFYQRDPFLFDRFCGKVQQRFQKIIVCRRKHLQIFFQNH